MWSTRDDQSQVEGRQYNERLAVALVGAGQLTSQHQSTCSHQEISEKERLFLYNVHVYRQIHVNNNNKTNINAWPCHFFATVCQKMQNNVFIQPVSMKCNCAVIISAGELVNI